MEATDVIVESSEDLLMSPLHGANWEGRLVYDNPEIPRLSATWRLPVGEVAENGLD
jgi:hypothetical protein